jgi:lysophospholipase L1-like esterase
MPKEWIFLAFGDSTPAGYGLAGPSYVEILAARIRAEHDIDVKLQNHAQSGETSRVLLERLEQDLALRAEVRVAQLITIWTGWNDFTWSLAQFTHGRCGGEQNLDCVRTTAHDLLGNMERILGEILALNSGIRPRVLVGDVGMPFARFWPEGGDHTVLRQAAYSAWREPLRAAVQARELTFVDPNRSLALASGDVTAGEFLQADGVHFNLAGHRLLAEVHLDSII